MKVWKWFTSLPWYAQLLIVAALAYVLYQVYLFIKRKIEAGNYNAAVTQSQTALNQLAQQGIHPTYAQAQYTTMANALEQAFSGCGAAYSNVVKPTFVQLKNDADIYALIKAYGVRDIAECAWGTFSGDLSATVGYKLTGFRFCSFDDAECGSVKDINKILIQNGLTFQF